MLFECCRNCVAPKRHPGCHGHCPEYLNDKKASDARRASKLRESSIIGGSYEQQQRQIRSALRKHGRKGT